MAYLLQWVMIYSYGINLNSIQWQSIGIMDKSWKHLGINTDLRIDSNSIPHTVEYLDDWYVQNGGIIHFHTENIQKNYKIHENSN